MRIVPVVDVLGGVAVWAVGGVRADYRPVVSKVCDSTDPVEVAKAMAKAKAVGAEDLYVADLDAITTGVSRLDYCRFVSLPLRIWIDAGIRNAEDVKRFPLIPNVNPILGTETLQSLPTTSPLSPASGERVRVGGNATATLNDCPITAAIETFGPPRVLLSLDHRNGNLIAPPDFTLQTAADAGIINYLALELTAVGRAGGIWSSTICADIRTTCPKNARIWVGGGVRSRTDVEAWAAVGADGVLVASAIHSGSL